MSKMIGVDVGGTFTDVIAIDEGRIVPAKVPTNVVSSDESVLEGARAVDAGQARVFNLASTAGLNAVITRNLPKVAYLTTEGHRDLLDRGSIGRPVEALTDPEWRRSFSDASRPLVQRYLRRGIRERVLADGSTMLPLDEDQARQQLRVLRKCDVDGVAICLLNSYVNPVHEQRLKELVLEELGDVVCSISSQVSPVAREYWRSSTTVVDVLMKIIYGAYTSRLNTGLSAQGFDGQFNYADCRAMLMPADYAMERPHHLVFGGPAAGTVSSKYFGDLVGEQELICADVGGTSCDISVIIGGRPWVNTQVALEHDLIVNAPSIDIITLGAGGGSIVSGTSEGGISVGPRSAGAAPGPAAYGHGGIEPTVTDAAVLIGVLGPEHFLGGRMALQPDLSEKAFQAIDSAFTFSERVKFAWLGSLTNIAEGLQSISIRRGIDIRDFTLMAYGAAGPMLLPSVLDLLPMRRVVIPPYPGLFSALGLVSSDQLYSEHRSSYTLLSPDSAEAIDAIYNDIEAALLARVGADADVVVSRSFDGRLMGQGSDTPFVAVPMGPVTPQSVASLIAEFHAEYESRNGIRFEQLPVQAVTFRVEVRVRGEKVTYQKLERADGEAPEPEGSVMLEHLYESRTSARTYERGRLRPGHRLDGPAIVREDTSTTFVPIGRVLTVGDYGELVVE